MPLPNRAKVSLSRKRAQTLQSQQLQQPKPVEASKITLKKASSSIKQLTRQQENIMSEDNPHIVAENHNNDTDFNDYTHAENNGFSNVADDYSQLDYPELNFDSIGQEPNDTNNSVIDPILDYNNSGGNGTIISDDDTSEQVTISPFAINTDYSIIDSNKYANSSPVNEQASTPNGETENVEIPPILDYDNSSIVEADNGGVYNNANNASENEPDDNSDAENEFENVEKQSDENTIDVTDTTNTTDNADDADENDAENEANTGKKAFKFMNLKALITQAKNEIGGKSSENDENASNNSETGKNAGKNANFTTNNTLKNSEILENSGNLPDEQGLAENGDNAENPDSEKSNNGKNAENGGKTGKNSGNAGNNPVVKILKPIIALPLGAIRLVLRVLSVCFHGVYAIISSLGTILVLWVICNIPSIILNTSADFDQDEGTTSVSNIKYDSKTGRIDAKITNSSDMIAHVDVGGELVSWQPFAKLPFSLFMPQQTGQCSNITISQINPDETRNITIQCSNAQGVWVRPKVVMKGI